MSPVHRTLEGDALVHHLTRDEQMIDPALLAQHGRTARTIAKQGPLRLTIIAVAAGGELPPHDADGPVAIHLLEGEVLFLARGREFILRPRDVLVLAAGVEHSARSATGCLLLLTVVHTDPRFESHPSPEMPSD
jgi:quercetin dioxygenase-like cupin family protein